MRQRRTSGEPLTNGRQGLRLTVLAFAFCLLAVGSAAQAGPTGDEYNANVFGALVFAADGSAISMNGQINFNLAPGKSASNGGTYRIGIPGACSTDAAACFEDGDCSGGQTCAGSDFASGTWEATQLEGFVVKGLCADFPDCVAAGVPESFTAGKGTFKIDMSGQGSARFIMWCRLPGIPLPPFNAFPESYRVDIGSLHFDSQNPAGNLFETCPCSF